MTTQTQLRYQEVPRTGLWLATTKALNEQGNPIVSITWYDSKLWVQERGLVLPTSEQWSQAREYFGKKHPEIEKDMITGQVEWTDSLIAWPNSDGKYANNLNPNPKEGKYPLLIENSVVERRNGNYVIDGGERLELPNFPRSSDRLKNPIPELELISQAYLWSNPAFDYEQGLRAVVRGRYLVPRERRFDASADGGAFGVGFGPWLPPGKERTGRRREKNSSETIRFERFAG